MPLDKGGLTRSTENEEGKNMDHVEGGQRHEVEGVATGERGHPERADERRSHTPHHRSLGDFLGAARNAWYILLTAVINPCIFLSSLLSLTVLEIVPTIPNKVPNGSFSCAERHYHCKLEEAIASLLTQCLDILSDLASRSLREKHLRWRAITCY